MDTGKAKTYCTRQGDGMSKPSLPGDVGHNLPHPGGDVIPAQGYKQIMTGIHVEFPHNVWGLILARSSANRSGKLIVLPGVIDQGYRGELTALVHNVAHRTWKDTLNNLLHKLTIGKLGYAGSENDVTVDPGKAVSQLVFFQVCVPSLDRVPDEKHFSLPTERGHNGYGSTGSAVKVQRYADGNSRI